MWTVTVSLLQVWMRRQHLSGQPDGFNGFLMSMLAAHLVQQSRLVSKYHSLVLQKLCYTHSCSITELYHCAAFAARLCRLQSSTLHCTPRLRPFAKRMLLPKQSLTVVLPEEGWVLSRSCQL